MAISAKTHNIKAVLSFIQYEKVGQRYERRYFRKMSGFSDDHYSTRNAGKLRQITRLHDISYTV